MKNNICFAIAAGCSGGHIIPAITLASNQASTIIAFTRNDPRDTALCAHPRITHVIPLSFFGIPRTLFQAPISLLQCFTATILSTYYLLKYRPTRVITTGSYSAIPVCLAATLLRIPIDLYELNVEPGKAVMLINKLASKRFCCFAQTTKKLLPYQATVIEYPVRFSDNDRTMPVNHAAFGLTETRRTLFILGGSQGSQALNRLIKTFITDNKPIDLQIIHQTGENDQENWIGFYEQHSIPAHVFSFNADLAPLYRMADAIVTRAGAGTLAEIAFFEIPALVIPLKTATTAHQALNAHAYAEKYPKLFTCVEQSELNAADLQKFIEKVAIQTGVPHHERSANLDTHQSQNQPKPL